MYLFEVQKRQLLGDFNGCSYTQGIDNNPKTWPNVKILCQNIHPSDHVTSIHSGKKSFQPSDGNDFLYEHGVSSSLPRSRLPIYVYLLPRNSKSMLFITKSTLYFVPQLYNTHSEERDSFVRSLGESSHLHDNDSKVGMRSSDDP